MAVLACGVDIGYPAGHVRLLDAIEERGLVVSEYPLGCRPARHRFLVRNRLIAALSQGTVVVEAGVRSGAKNTAAAAELLGRPVMAVPGPVTSAKSVGCHDLLRASQAVVVTGAADVLELAGRIGFDLVPPGQPPPERRTDRLKPQALRVHGALSDRFGRSPEEVAAESGVALPKVRALLPELELAGLARRGDTGWCRAGP